MIELGLSWWKSDEISVERYFKFIPSKYDSRIILQRSSEIENLENRLMGNETVHISDNSQLIRLRELEKDVNLNDLLLVFDQCFKNSKNLISPKTEELISQDMIRMAERILAIKKKL